MHALDILCLSELGELGVGIGKKLPEGDVIAWIHKLLADSAVSPVAIYADGHYATLVLSDRALVQGRNIHAAILRGSKQRAVLSDQGTALLDDFTCGRLARVRDDCDAAFGWNKEMRTAAGSAAIRIGR